MEDYIEKTIVWESVLKHQPDKDFPVLIGGSGINVGVLVKKKGELMWKLQIRSKETYAPIIQFPYWSDVIPPFSSRKS